MIKYTLKKSGNMSNRVNAVDDNGNKLFVIENGYSEDNRVDREIINLIYAAPDLLEALKKGAELMEYLINATPTGKVRDTMCDFNIIARSAIQKALF